MKCESCGESNKQLYKVRLVDTGEIIVCCDDCMEPLVN